MSMEKKASVDTFMQTLAGEEVELNPRLMEIFSNVLQRQLEEDDNGNITPKGNFETLAQIFTFAATPSGDRPSTPFAYAAALLQEAQDAAIDSAGVDKIYNTDGNNYLVGTDGADVFVLSKGGNDEVSARDGDDTFVISGSGKKTLLSTGGKETIDLSQALYAADVDLSKGGTIGPGYTEIQFGTQGGSSGVYQEASKNNIMLIIDVSGSMWGTNLANAKQAAYDLFDAYEENGETAVRIVTFSSGVSSNFNGIDGWMDLDTARSVISGLSAYGETNYNSALNKAMEAFDKGKGDVYLEGGVNVSYFMSDGVPDIHIDSSLQDTWEIFAINNQIVSNAIGFDGINHTDPLKLITFDGTRLTDPTEDRGPAQIEPLIEYDSETLANTIVKQANLDFIENIIGTPFDDVITGNSLDNEIDFSAGGENTYHVVGGNDIILGGDDFDTVVFDGVMKDWDHISTSNGWLFTRNDNTVVVDNNVEWFQFDNGFTSLDWTGPDSNWLLNQYAPALALSTGKEPEQFQPISIEAFIDNAVLWHRDADSTDDNFTALGAGKHIYSVYSKLAGDTVETEIAGYGHNIDISNDLFKLDLTNPEKVRELIDAESGEYFLDFANEGIKVPGSTTLRDTYTPDSLKDYLNKFDYEQYQEDYGASVFGRVVNNDFEQPQYLQYHFHYLQDTWATNHEGEWEFMQIRLNEEFEPETLMSSVHLSSAQIEQSDTLSDWIIPQGDQLKAFDGEDYDNEAMLSVPSNPLVYIGNEGHPTYLNAGETKVGFTDFHNGLDGRVFVPRETLDRVSNTSNIEGTSIGNELIEYELVNLNENSDIEDWLSLDLGWGHNGEDHTNISAGPKGPGENSDNRWSDPETWLYRHDGDWDFGPSDMIPWYEKSGERILRGQEYEIVSVDEANNTIKVELIGNSDGAYISQDWLV